MQDNTKHTAFERKISLLEGVVVLLRTELVWFLGGDLLKPSLRGYGEPAGCPWA